MLPSLEIAYDCPHTTQRGIASHAFRNISGTSRNQRINPCIPAGRATGPHASEWGAGLAADVACLRGCCGADGNSRSRKKQTGNANPACLLQLHSLFPGLLVGKAQEVQVKSSRKSQVKPSRKSG